MGSTRDCLQPSYYDNQAIPNNYLATHIQSTIYLLWANFSFLSYRTAQIVYLQEIKNITSGLIYE